jgi:hypothetical protein
MLLHPLRETLDPGSKAVTGQSQKNGIVIVKLDSHHCHKNNTSVASVLSKACFVVTAAMSSAFSTPVHPVS